VCRAHHSWEGTPEAVVQGKFTALGLQHGTPPPKRKQRPRRTPVFPPFPIRPAQDEPGKTRTVSPDHPPGLPVYSVARLPHNARAKISFAGVRSTPYAGGSNAKNSRRPAALRRIPDQSALHVFHRETSRVLKDWSRPGGLSQGRTHASPCHASEMCRSDTISPALCRRGDRDAIVRPDACTGEADRGDRSARPRTPRACRRGHAPGWTASIVFLFPKGISCGYHGDCRFRPAVVADDIEDRKELK
jgi:hypothetical protein